MSKIFGFLKNLLQFLKIFWVFCILMLLLYWTKNLAHFSWNWMGFISPFLDGFIAFGKMISNDSLKLFDAVFEYKYFWALVSMIAMYFVTHFLHIGAEALEAAYDEGKKIVKRIEENKFNENLERVQVQEQIAIRKYCIYVETSLKKKFSHLECNVDINEQNKIMNKFLMEKLLIAPAVYDKGFLYSFNDFNSIDKVLEYFFKLIKSNSPLNYVICVQAKSGNDAAEEESLKTLIDLKFENKISMLSDVAYRYKFNASHRYGTSQIGVFQKGNSTIEAHEFIEI